MKDLEICENLNKNFDLSQQAILIGTHSSKCLYFEKWGNNFLLDIFDFFLKNLANNDLIYLSNGYRSDLFLRHFIKFSIIDFYKFITTDNFEFEDETGIYKYEEFKAMGIILTSNTFSWIIHRDPDFGTISFAYDNTISSNIIDTLKKSEYFIDENPRKSFFTDEL